MPVVKQKSLAVLEKELDLIFGQFIKLRDSRGNSFINCFVCGKPVKINESEVLHFIGRSNMVMRYDEVNCNSGCVDCNKFDPNHQEKYRAKLVAKHGGAVVYDLNQKSRGLQKFIRCDIIDMIEYYKSEIVQLKKHKS
jgi:hypothetical protein